MVTCWTCKGVPPYCEACVARWVEVQRANAATVGRAWAESVVARLRREGRELAAWPAYDDSGRVRLLAVAKVKHFAGPDDRVRDALGRVCAEAAAERYLALASPSLSASC